MQVALGPTDLYSASHAFRQGSQVPLYRPVAFVWLLDMGANASTANGQSSSEQAAAAGPTDYYARKAS